MRPPLPGPGAAGQPVPIIPAMANHPNRGARGPAANPTPQEIRDLRMEAGLSQSQAADLVLGTLRGWQGWEADPGTPDHRRMPPGLWLLFRARVMVRAGDAAEAIRLLEEGQG